MFGVHEVYADTTMWAGELIIRQVHQSVEETISEQQLIMCVIRGIMYEQPTTIPDIKLICSNR